MTILCYILAIYFGTSDGYFGQAALTQISQMESGYIDASTRAIAVSFNIYNVNTDIFTVAQIMFMFHGSGHVEPYDRIAPVRLMEDCECSKGRWLVGL